MVDKNKKYKTRLLSDDPVWDDAFASDGDPGPHKRVAKAIADLIRDDDEGKAIALNGGWGSGKSSVVKMLEKEVEKDKIEIFEFDAWAHKGDNLRRAFLAQLIEKVILYNEPSNKKPIKKRTLKEKNIQKWWQNERKNLGKQVIQSRSSPNITMFGAGMGFFVLISALYLALVQNYGLDAWDKFGNTSLYVGIFFPVIAGIIIIAIFWVFHNVILWFQKNILDFKYTSPKSHFATVSESVTDSTSVSTPIPSSIEFEDTYFKALKLILESKYSKKLVLVIDNLDRIDKEESMDIWATMRSFYEIRKKMKLCDDRYSCDEETCVREDREKRNCWLKRLWLVVPFDYDAIDRMWKEENQNKANETIACAFTKKTFQVTYNVATPILDNWRDYMRAKLRVAFPVELVKEELFEPLITIFRLRYLSKDHLVTPRDVITFINDLVAVYSQWGYDPNESIDKEYIPIRCQALYVALKRNGEDILGLLSNPDDSKILGPISYELLMVKESARSVRISLAAIHFNVPKEKATKRVDRALVMQALQIGESQGYQDAFDADTVVSVLRDFYSPINELSGKEIALAAFALGGSTGSSGRHSNEAWNILANSAELVEDWAPMGPNVGVGLIYILTRRQNPDFADAIVKSLSNTSPVTNEKEIEPNLFEIQSWAEGMKVCLTYLRKHGSFIHNFTVHGPAHVYVAVLSYLHRYAGHDDILKYFLPSVDHGEVIRYLANQANSSYGQVHSSAIKTLLHVRNSHNFPLEKLIDKLSQNLFGSQLGNIHLIYNSLLTLLYLKDAPLAFDSLKKISLEGQFFKIIEDYRGDVSVFYKNTAACILSELIVNPKYRRNSGALDYPVGRKLFNDILQRPEVYGYIIRESAALTIDLDLREFLTKLAESNIITSMFIENIFNKIKEQ